jgi:CTP:molybdopterin cytidylyltransferase MocA
VFPELAQLTGDRGAREVVLREPGRTAMPEMGVPPSRDVDTLADLRTLQGPP